MISSLEIIFIFATIFSQHFEFCFCACARAEYKIDRECCPMCAPGNRVYRHCTGDTSTTCVPCLAATFLDAPNGLTECFSCTVCDPVLGLRVNTACTQTSDTVCEPLDGYYCREQGRGSCIYAEKHANCSPGQYVKHRGTAFKNTECAGCPDGTYSNGSLQICLQHSKCEDLGLTEIKAGTLTSDAECGDKTPAALIAGITVPLIIVAIAVAVIIFLRIKQKINLVPGLFQTSPTEETGFQQPAALSTPNSSVIPMLNKTPDREEPEQISLNMDSGIPGN